MSGVSECDWLERVHALHSFGRPDEVVAEAGRALIDHPGSAALWSFTAVIELDRGGTPPPIAPRERH